MNIEGTSGLNPLTGPDGSAPRSAAERAAPAAGDAASRVDTDDVAAAARALAARAPQAGAVRPDKVAEARRLLASGELDTPEAAGRAAEALLDFGI